MGSLNSRNQEKRIFNIIWNSANSYDYFPGFIGNDISGDPDFYFNIVIGLAVKYFGKENMDKLFSQWEDSLKSRTYDYLTWICLEEVLYKKEVKVRPVLKTLRKEYAENFFLDKNDPHRRKFALQNPLLYSIQVQRMKDILGIKKKSLSKKEKQIYENLTFSDDVSFYDLENTLIHTYIKYLKFNPEKKSSAFSKIIRKTLPVFAFHPLERSIRPSYLLSEDKKDQSNGLSSIVYTIKAKHSKKQDEQIESVFGKSIFSSKENYALIEKYCQGPHKKSRLWYTKGIYDKTNINEMASRAKDFARKRNKRAFEKNIQNYKNQINNLSRSIKSSLNSSVSSCEILADHGSLIGNIAWKSKLPKENHIFSIKTFREKSFMSIDLLIDGSASLLDFQEDMAIEAYILAKSLEKCKIPLRITAYASLDDYTVLTILKDFEEKANQDRIFSYYAQGWNRDGLAFKAFEKLIEDRKKENQLLLIMTDSNPRDLKPYITEKFAFNKAYDGKDGLKDTKKSLETIRKKGTSVAGVVNTSSFDDKSEPIENSKYLYGRNFASIDSVLNFSNIAKRLIKNEISRLNRKN